MSERGFYLVPRGLFEDGRFKPREPFSDLMAWLWLNEYAAHSPREIAAGTGSNTKIVRLERGQLTYSIRYLAKAWRWSDKRVQRFLATTQADQLLTTETTTGQTLITLCNYDKEQRRFDDATTPATTGTTTATTTNKKQFKQLESICSPRGEPEGFADWYGIYPRKKQRKAAARAFGGVIRGELIELSVLMERTRAFAAGWSQRPAGERQFIPYPATWLNKGGYDDEPGDGGDPVPSPTIDPRNFTAAQWKARLREADETGKWRDLWGPEPGRPGCLVPPQFLLTPVSGKGSAA